MLKDKALSEDLKLKWYPFYTRSRFEKKTFDLLHKAGFEVYLPLKKSTRQWSDRKKIVELPLFASYIFVRIPKYKLNDILVTPGIVRYIRFNGQPAIIRDKEIEMIKKVLSSNTEIEVVDGKVEVGADIKISSGIFKGYDGKVVEIKGKHKVVLEIESINKSILVTVELNKIISEEG